MSLVFNRGGIFFLDQRANLDHDVAGWLVGTKRFVEPCRLEDLSDEAHAKRLLQLVLVEKVVRRVVLAQKYGVATRALVTLLFGACAGR